MNQSHQHDLKMKIKNILCVFFMRLCVFWDHSESTCPCWWAALIYPWLFLLLSAVPLCCTVIANCVLSESIKLNPAGKQDQLWQMEITPFKLDEFKQDCRTASNYSTGLLHLWFQELCNVRDSSCFNIGWLDNIWLKCIECFND